MAKQYIVGIAGGSGSGKSHFLNKIRDAFSDTEVCLITQDNYYRPIDRQPRDASGIVNFDLPESIDQDRMHGDLKKLMRGQRITLQEYTFNNPAATARTLVFEPAPVIVVEGILVFCFEKINRLFDLRVFIDAREDIKIRRRVDRDRAERGYAPADVQYRYKHHVSPVFAQLVEPWREKADVVIPNNAGFDTGFAVLRDHLASEVGRRRK
jgi:uridine kinase